MINFPFKKVMDSLHKCEQVDSYTDTPSPVTIRWLTDKNTYINIGLEEVDGKSCAILANNNSFQVNEFELLEVQSYLLKVLGGKNEE